MEPRTINPELPVTLVRPDISPSMRIRPYNRVNSSFTSHFQSIQRSKIGLEKYVLGPSDIEQKIPVRPSTIGQIFMLRPDSLENSTIMTAMGRFVNKL